MLKESLRMENARQETLAAQVGARVEGNAIVAPDVGERAPLGSLPPPAGVGGALREAKLRWLERTYGKPEVPFCNPPATRKDDRGSGGRNNCSFND